VVDAGINFCGGGKDDAGFRTVRGRREVLHTSSLSLIVDSECAPVKLVDPVWSGSASAVALINGSDFKVFGLRAPPRRIPRDN
jgi:hypothetical protein